jgi:hypothetical protein
MVPTVTDLRASCAVRPQSFALADPASRSCHFPAVQTVNIHTILRLYPADPLRLRRKIILCAHQLIPTPVTTQTIAGSRMQGMSPEKLSRLWLTLGLRLSVFPLTSWDAPTDLWERIVGEPHETEQSQPRQRLRVQSGPWQGGLLQVMTSPSNIVWTALPAPDADGFPDFDKWPVVDILPAFVALTRAWLVSTDFDIMRIGFGLTGLLSAPDKISSYQILQELIPSVRIDPEETSDFFYQINRPISSGVLGSQVHLNRLMKWNSRSFALTQLQISPNVAQASPVVDKYYATLENDTNTPNELRGALEKSLLGAIYDELVGLAWGNLERGEMG